jgi:hypothetical protein
MRSVRRHSSPPRIAGREWGCQAGAPCPFAGGSAPQPPQPGRRPGRRWAGRGSNPGLDCRWFLSGAVKGLNGHGRGEILKGRCKAAGRCGGGEAAQRPSVQSTSAPALERLKVAAARPRRRERGLPPCKFCQPDWPPPPPPPPPPPARPPRPPPPPEGLAAPPAAPPHFCVVAPSPRVSRLPHPNTRRAASYPKLTLIARSQPKPSGSRPPTRATSQPPAAGGRPHLPLPAASSQCHLRRW